MFDVTLSVWNKFWSFPLIRQLTLAGFDVLGLGTTRRRPECAEYRCAWASAFLTQASYHSSACREFLTQRALRRYETFAERHALEARCLWGWSNHHLGAFRQAKARGIPVIIEVGSTHSRWQQRVVASEYERHGLDFSSRDDLETRERAIAEYEVADRICVPSHFVARTFLQSGVPAERIQINAFGADIGFWSEAIDAKEKAKGKCVFIYVAQVMLRKGIAYLLEASRQLEPDRHELWFVGGIDPDSRHLMQALPSNIKLLGLKNHLEIRDLYKRAHVFVLPSLEEGMARSLLEAMAAGLPVIATEETGISDIMVDKEDGWLVPSHDGVALAAAMQQAVNDPEIVRERGQSAARRVAPYTWDAYGERAAKFFRNFMKARR